MVHGSFRFVTNPSWEQFAISFETHLYQRPEFTDLAPSNKMVSFGIARSDKPELLGFIAFNLVNGQAGSGFAKPFGGLDYSHSIDPEVLDHFLLFIEEQLKAIAIEKIDMRLPAMVYMPSKISQWSKVLESRHYIRSESVANHHLLVNVESFEYGLHTMERRKLKKSRELGLEVATVALGKLDDVYHFIKACRDERGQSLSLSWPEMNAAALALPQAYILFKATLDNVMVAAAIVVRVNERILYNFYPASALRYQSYSPQVLLLDAIYQYAQKHQYEILDLGTSMVAGEPKANLITFKERVCGIATAKFRYTKSLL